HPLAVEDAAKGHQRPKLEEYEDDQFFIVLRTARYDDAQEVVEFGEVHAFLGRSYVVVVRHGHANELRGVRERLEARPHLVDRGPGAVVWAILDKIVDDYAPVIDGLENDIEEVERAIFEGGPDQSQRIYLLRRELAGFYRAVHPLLAPLEAVERGAYPAIDAELRAYFRDVADHTRIVNDEVLMQRDLLDGVLSANLATIGVRQNDVVRKVSGWAAIVTVPTLIASVYGMNFEHMPELGWAFGYPLALALMVVCALGLWRFLRRVGWL
ncbi:MAG: magnesium and cobalt transport protein CorA, partial [Solirubrobacterales bacterium]|nr:magnesium and cobalt transport protein CorA [Solirubrobacterales bacterium]